jgi:hypothetical protein
MIIAFDCDGTLLNLDGTPNEEVVSLARWFIKNGDRVYIWSGGGESYAGTVARRCKLQPFAIAAKNKYAAEALGIELAFDDEFVTLGKLNVKIAPTPDQPCGECGGWGTTHYGRCAAIE